MSLQIRSTVYRDKPGFLICGRDAWGHKIAIFTLTRFSAEHIRETVRLGREVQLSDFHVIEGICNA